MSLEKLLPEFPTSFISAAPIVVLNFQFAFSNTFSCAVILSLSCLENASQNSARTLLMSPDVTSPMVCPEVISTGVVSTRESTQRKSTRV